MSPDAGSGGPSGVSRAFRARRLLLSKWRRFTRWEFWPLWAVQTPVCAYLLWLALRHRGLGTFCAANPAIPAGGFVGESKSQILAQIKAGEFVARFAKIPAGNDAQKFAKRFMSESELSFPIVIKPDAGQRGLGVAIIHGESELEDYFAKERPDSIVQEFAAGQEFGVLYFRCPGEPRGHIFSVTEKRFPVITGDGASTLERLILLDDRAVCSAAMFLEKNHARLGWIPAEGEKVPLTDIGNHCRGTVFLDGAHILTPDLESAIDRIAQSFDGFYFGRFDIRTPSPADFQRGRNFKIIELNGATSEATHIYDPRHNYFYGQRILREQWRILFAIGAANRARGAKIPTVLELAKMLLDYEPANEA
jgi:hypothetical protein